PGVTAKSPHQLLTMLNRTLRCCKLQARSVSNCPSFLQVEIIDHKQSFSLLESVRRDYAGLHSFLSMSLIEARRRKASALRLRFSQSLARRLQRPSHAKVRSTTHRFGRTTNAFA